MLSFMTPLKNTDSMNRIFDAKNSAAEQAESSEIFNIIPLSRKGQLSLVILFSGLLLFFCGVIMGSQDLDYASHTAVAGMTVFFTGGWLRTRFS